MECSTNKVHEHDTRLKKVEMMLDSLEKEKEERNRIRAEVMSHDILDDEPKSGSSPKILSWAEITNFVEKEETDKDKRNPKIRIVVVI